MKKIFTAAIMLFVFLLSSCAGPDADSVAKKLAEGKSLDQKDYTVMIDYCISATDDMTKTVRKGNVDDKTVSELDKKYSHFSEFLQSIVNAGDLDAENTRLFDKLNTKLQDMFSAAVESSDMPVDIDVKPDSVSVTEQ